MTQTTQLALLEVLLDTQGAAKILNIPAKTITKWRSTGENDIPYIRIGRAIRYKPSDLIAYIERHTVGGVA